MHTECDWVHSQTGNSVFADAEWIYLLAQRIATAKERAAGAGEGSRRAAAGIAPYRGAAQHPASNACT